MSLINDIETIHIEPDDARSIENQLGYWEVMVPIIRSWKTPRDAVPYLKIELETRKRIYYVQRMYGKYRKLLPGQDIPDMMGYMNEET